MIQGHESDLPAAVLPGVAPVSPMVRVSIMWRHRLIVPALLVLCATLAISSLLGDSITFDETSHLTAGMNILRTGSFRLTPDHPPLGQVWCAWPLLFVHNAWPPPETPSSYDWAAWELGRAWLFQLNDGERFLPIARSMMVLLLLALCLTVYALSRTLFGPAAGLLSLVLAVLSPTLLAHGRLVTTDMPVTLAIALTLLTGARLLRRVTCGRVLALAGALGAASVTKMSWPLVMPALLIMAGMAISAREGLEIPAPFLQFARPRSQTRWRLLSRPSRRALAVGVVAAVLAITTPICIWTCYGWRASMFPPTAALDGAGMLTTSASRQETEKFEADWRRLTHDELGVARHGWVPAFLRWARTWQVLPDSYLFGLGLSGARTSQRPAYFCGQTSDTGWRWYFPVAFATKTPIATQVLTAAGIAAVLRRRGRSGDRVLLAGVTAFLVTYCAYVSSSAFNIGHRHLLPIYPGLFVLAGASAAWLEQRLSRGLIAAAVLWLAGANLWIHPHYLSYFNEFIGGPANGHLYLADSNIDWGQDLKRLARYARERPAEPIKLLYFGSADARAYGFPCELVTDWNLLEVHPFDGDGTYVVSVTLLVGVYFRPARDSFWEDPRHSRSYGELAAMLRSRAANDAPRMQAEWVSATERYARYRCGRLLYNLRRRSPDQRIGYSLFVYRLSQADIDALTR